MKQIMFFRRLRDCWKILFSKDYILTSRTPRQYSSEHIRISYTMSEFDVKRYSLFMYNFIDIQDSAVQEANDILDL